MSRCVCPRIVESEWQDCEHVWNKTFFRLPSPRFFSIPVHLGSDLGNVVNLARAAGYDIVESPRMLLSRYAMFRGELLVEVVDGEGGHPAVRRFRGTRLYSQIYEGHWRSLGSGVRRLVASVGRRPRHIYFWYVTCPLCAEERGYKTVILAEL